METPKKHPLDRALENIEKIKRTNPDRYNRIINRCWDRYADEIVRRMPSLLDEEKSVDANPLSERIRP
ncbi:hypothetical protein EBR66_08315 [bacterium]|nr:hypothetical protein [bacterium]